MSPTRAAELAARFEEAHREFLATLQSLADDVWTRTCPGEDRPVYAVAHHIADGYALQLIAFRKVAAGAAFAPLSSEELDRGNAERAARAAESTREEIADLARRRAARVAAFVRGLTDEQLARSGVYLDWLPAMTLDQLAERILVGHVYAHLRAIREAAEQ